MLMSTIGAAAALVLAARANANVVIINDTHYEITSRSVVNCEMDTVSNLITKHNGAYVVYNYDRNEIETVYKNGTIIVSESNGKVYKND